MAPRRTELLPGTRLRQPPCPSPASGLRPGAGFPPRYRLALLLLLVAAPLAATSPAADSTRADSLPSPRGALLRSALLPGWGQFYNHKPRKALFFGATTASLLSWTIAAQRDLDRTADQLADLRRREPDSALLPRLGETHQDQAARRNTRILFAALAATFAALDAYVDAQLADFTLAAAPLALHPRPGGALLCLRASW